MQSISKPWHAFDVCYVLIAAAILPSGHPQHAQLTTGMDAAAAAPPPKHHLFTILKEDDAPTSEKEISTNRQVSMAG